MKSDRFWSIVIAVLSILVGIVIGIDTAIYLDKYTTFFDGMPSSEIVKVNKKQTSAKYYLANALDFKDKLDNNSNPFSMYHKAQQKGLSIDDCFMTIPNQDNCYNVYIKSLNDKKFDNSAVCAVSSWHRATGIPFRIVSKQSQAQIRIYQIPGQIDKTDDPEYVVAGEAFGYYGCLNHHTLILASKDACKQSGVNYYKILCHELGHTLGLDHNKLKNDIMNTHENGKQVRKNEISYHDAHLVKTNYDAIISAERG